MMKRILHSCSAIRTEGAVLALLVLSQLAYSEVTIKPVSGPYGQYSVEGVWAQRVVTFENPDTREMRVKFSFLTDDPSRGRMEYSRLVSVPANCLKKATVVYRPGTLTPLRAGQSGGNKPVSCEQLWLLENARTGIAIPQAAQQTTKLPAGLTRICLVAGIETPGDSGQYLGQLSNNQLGAVQLMNEKLSNLPDVWYGYSMADMVVVGGVDTAQMRPAQIDAMLNWTQRGGLLILTGSSALDRMLQGRLGRAAGVSVVGLHDVADLQIADQRLRRTSAEISPAMPMVELQVEQAETIYTANGLPFITKRNFGHGHVIVLAVPIGGLSPQRLHKIWANIRNVGRSLGPLNPTAFEQAGQETLRQIAGQKGATRAAPVTVLLALTALVLVSGAALRFKRRGELVWLMLIPVAIAVSFALYAYGRTLSDPERLRHIGLISGLGDDRARLQEAFAYYSGPEQQLLGFAADSPGGLMTEIGAGGAGVTSELLTLDGTELPPRTIRGNQTNAFYVDTVENLAVVEPALSLDGEGIVGTIRNLLPDDLEDAVIYANRIPYRLGTLPAGADTEVSITSQSQLAAGEFTGGSEIKPRRNELTRALVSSPSDVPGARRGGPRVEIRYDPILIGYTPHSPLDPISGRQLQRGGWCVVNWPVGLKAPPEGTEVTIPAGFVKVRETGNLRDPQTGGYRDEGGVVEFRASPPPPIGRLSGASAEITVDLNAPNFKLAISGGQLNANGDIVPKEEIQTYDSPSGTYKVTVPQADRFAGPDGDLLFHLRIRRSESAGGYMAKTIKANVNSLQIALKGTVR